MKALFVVALLLPLLALAQSAPISNRTNNSTVTGTQTANAFTCSNTTTATFLSSTTATGGNDTGFTFKTSNALNINNDTDTIFHIANSTTPLFYFRGGGRFDMEGATNSSQPGFKIATPSGGLVQARLAGGSGESFQIYGNALVSSFYIGDSSHASAKVFIGPEAFDSGVELTIEGARALFNVPAIFDSTDSSATPGAVTINKPAGKGAIAAGASSVVVTNSFITAASIVVPVLQQVDGTCTQILSVVPAAGSATITANANCTGATKVAFVVH